MNNCRSRAGRQALALRAATAVARRHGLLASEPRVLSDCNNTIVHLAPLPVVAKVCHTRQRPAGAAALSVELAIAQHLAGAGAPVVPPSQELSATVHWDSEQALTFWRYQERDPESAFDPGSARRALRDVHAVLDRYRAPLPSFLDRQVRRAGRLLADPTALPALPPGDRDFLTAEHRRLTGAIRGRQLDPQTLHGDPHRGNFLVRRGRHLLIDFESACSGPVEWDLSALPAGGADPISADPDLLAILRRLRSLCVAVWCKSNALRSPELDCSGSLHLAVLRRRQATEEPRQPLVA